MKLLHQFHIFPPLPRHPPFGNYVAEHVFNECRSRWPSCFRVGKASVEVRAEPSDPLYSQTLQFLESHQRWPYLARFPSLSDPSGLGLPDYGSHLDRPHLFQVYGSREFSPGDMKSAACFWMLPQTHIGDGGHHKGTNQLFLERGAIKKQPVGGTIGTSYCLCTDALRTQMEAEGFVGLGFRDVVIVGKKPTPEPYWQIYPDLRMPRLLNRLIGEDGKDFDPARARETGCRVDDFYWPELLRFPEKGVKKMSDFDLAFTQEKFGSAPGPYYKGTENYLLDHYLIASRRFREWCLQRKLKLSFYPVVLE